MSFAKITSAATLAALLALGGPVLAQTNGTVQQQQQMPNAGAMNPSPDSRATGAPMNMSPDSSMEGRNSTTEAGQAKAAGSGNSDDGRRDCTGQQLPC